VQSQFRTTMSRWHPRRFPRWAMLPFVCAGLLAAGLALWAACGESDAERVARQVRAELPIGTHRREAAAWITRTYGVLPTFSDDVTGNQICGLTIPERAGVPANELGGMLYFTVRRRGKLADILDRVHYDHLWVYLLLDQDQRIRDYFFFSFEDLRKAEQQRAAQPR
jgi:hypothetical protein